MLFLCFALIGGPAFATETQLIPPLLAKAARASIVFGMLAGTLLTAATYLFFIWLVFRHLSQILLTFMLLLLTVHMVFTSHFIMNMVGFEDAVLQGYIRNGTLLGFFLICFGFTINFLDLESHLPNLRRALFGMMGLEALGLISGSIFMREQLNDAMPIISALNMGIMLLIGLAAALRGISGSITHILAFAVFLVGSLAVPLQQTKLIAMPQVLAENMIYCAAAVAAVIFAAVIAQQFTAQQEAKEKALQRSNERFTLATQGANEGLYDWDIPQGRVYFSERFKRIVNRSLSGDKKGLKELWRLIEPADRLKLHQTLHAFRRTDKHAVSAEFRVRRSTGGVVWIFATAVAIRDKRSKKVVRMVGAFGDITAKKQSEHAMRLSEARFRSITEAHPVPVLIVKLSNGAIMYASPGTEPLVKIPQSALIGSSLHRLLGAMTSDFLGNLPALKHVDMQEASLYHSDGSTMPVAVSARIIDYQNEAAAVIGIYDLTERKRAEAQIAKQQEALQQSEKMAALGGLLAGVAHELNNPLSVIVGQSTLLRETAQDEKTVARGEKIFTAAERCARIVKSFLAIARRKPPEHKLMQLNDAVHAALELLTYPLRTENVQLKLELDDKLPQIIGDQDQFTQVISNLVLNGAQAMKDWKGKRDIIVKTYVDKETGHACLSVSDTGPGIPNEIKVRVFEPFFTTKAPGSGTGVGLSLCLNIVTAHGGQLNLQDTPGGGATFYIHLPLPEQQQAKENKAMPTTTTAAGAAAPAERKPLKILLVDDEFELAQTLADLLSKDGHSFDFAINGRIALEKLRAQKFDFILSDLRMPEMDGPTMFKHICAELPEYRQRIVFITGDTLTTFVRDFLQDNPVRFIEKPYTLLDVTKAIADQMLVVEGQSTSATAA